MASKEKEVESQDPRNALGRRGEEIAARFFAERGYEIAARNWRCRFGEIDLVARKGEEWRIVEVKTRRSLSAGYPEESITDEKLEHLEQAAAQFIDAQGLVDPDVHFDVLAITFREGEADCLHLSDISY